MIRGDRGKAALVLASVLTVGALAIVTMVGGPSGLLVEGQSMYVTVPADELGLYCHNNQAVYLNTNGRFQQYCCIENMIGQNHCQTIHNILT